MNIDFINILIKFLKLKNIFKLILNLFFLFLPAGLAAQFTGTEGWLFKITLTIALIASNGYLYIIFQNEVEQDSNDLPAWNFITDFATGIKGAIFSLASLILLFLVLTALYFLIVYVPASRNFALTAAGVWFVYWLLMFNPVAMGIFSEKFNPVEALKFSTVAEIINACWLNYLIASVYLIAYITIIGLFGWACMIFFGPAYNFPVIAFFAVYALIVYFSLYAKVFKQIRTEFESHF